ncbi:hypothetical protein BGZ96_010984 [Linnemannia gamsii]|uniref:Beta-lactamase-related domain-containing protein n=1 Tax=Linnemannia gamsii TaxID=64522 RepID=A0ABQ7JTJ6_9FUNG|nr:hypothetical protein BGZ96_010984 [Linnemannia gamsii]
MSIPNLYKMEESPSFPYAETRRAIKRAMQRCRIPGVSVAVIHKNQLIFAEDFGKRNKTDPYSAEINKKKLTLQPISLVTKTFTTAAIASVKQHAGLGAQPRKELIKELRHIEDLPQNLSTDYKVNHIVYAVAGEAAANGAEASYEQIVLDKVIRPLGLVNTGFSQTIMKRHSENYTLSHKASSSRPLREAKFRVFPLSENPNMALAPVAGVYSNELDLFRRGKPHALVNTVILSRGKFDIILGEMDNEEVGGRVLRFKYSDLTGTSEHYENNTFIATFDDELSKIKILFSFIPDMERARQELPDSKEFIRETLGHSRPPLGRRNL